MHHDASNASQYKLKSTYTSARFTQSLVMRFDAKSESKCITSILICDPQDYFLQNIQQNFMTTILVHNSFFSILG